MSGRAIGIVRVSQVGGRSGESFASPDTQRDRIRAECERQDLTLTGTLEELDVSGGADLRDRPGLGPAVEAVEAGRADVIVAAYFDRFFRDMVVQSQVIARVEAAGGRVLAVDFGLVSHDTAAQWLSASVTGMMAEYYRRAAGERVAEAIQRAINRGAPPWPRVTAGYRKLPNGTYEPDPATAPVVRAAFELRAEGGKVEQVRERLRAGGVVLTYPGTCKLLRSRTVLGEIHFGKFTPNLDAFPAVVDRETWAAVQAVTVPRGRYAKSDRLLARLGVLLCGTCGARMVASQSRGARSKNGGGKLYPIYRCNAEDCPKKVTVAAEKIERMVWDVTRAALAGLEGEASVQGAHRAVAVDLEAQQARLEKLIELLDPFEPAAQKRIAAETEKRDALRARDAELRGLRDVRAVDVNRDDLTPDERRDLIRAALVAVRVAPGRSDGRFDFEVRRQ